MSSNQESPIKEHLSTIRLSFPPEDLTNIVRIRIVGHDLLLYVREDKIDTVTSTFTKKHGFNIVDRVYKLHVSAPSKEDFETTFGKVEYEDRSTDGRFIATVIVDSEEEYNKFLNLGKNQDCKCRVKAFRPRFANTHDEELKNKMDKDSPVHHGPQKPFSQQVRSHFGKVSRSKNQVRHFNQLQKGSKGTH